MNCGYILKVELVGFADEFNAEAVEKVESEAPRVFLAWVIERV